MLEKRQKKKMTGDVTIILYFRSQPDIYSGRKRHWLFNQLNVLNISFTSLYPYSQEAAVFDGGAGEEKEGFGLSFSRGKSKPNLIKLTKQN
jgi:hypothetical protein